MGHTRNIGEDLGEYIGEALDSPPARSSDAQMRTSQDAATRKCQSFGHESVGPLCQRCGNDMDRPIPDPKVLDEYAFLIFLLQKAKSLPPPTERERQAQALSFAHGNLSFSSNHQPTRESFRQLARDRYGWSDDEFAIFAATRKWK